MSNGWRTAAVALAAVCSWQAWRGCHGSSPRPTAERAQATHDRAPRDVSPAAAPDREGDARAPAPARATAEGPSLYGIKVPPWARSLLPAPGEDLRAYRDRMIPLAQLAIAPQRARVARSRDDMVQRLGLDRRQQAELDTQAREAAQAIQDRLFNAVLSGELAPSTFKPLAGVAVARDVLDLVDHANQRFVGSLSDGQRTQLSRLPFDFGDYLLFSTRWEDAISGL